MFVLMISSIILKLISVHLLLEHYREKKIELVTTLLSLLLICGFIINDFAALNFFLKESISGPQWFMVFLTFIMSVSLMSLMSRLRHPKIVSLNSEKANPSNELNDLLKSASQLFEQKHMIVINRDKKIVHMTADFKTLIGVNSRLTTAFSTTLDRLLGRHITIDDIPKLNKSVERIVGPSQFECYCKVSAYTVESSHLIVLSFEDYSEQVLLMEEQKNYKDRVNHYENLLNVGRWTYYFSDNMLHYSKQVQNMLGLLEDRMAYDAFKKLVHPEDLMLINILDSKTLWVSGLHTRHMRLRLKQGIKYATIHYETINDDNGLPIGASGVIQEISGQRDFIAGQFIKEKNDHISSFVKEFDNHLRPLLSTLIEEKRVSYAHEEINKVLEILDSNKRTYNQRKHNNLISADKHIEEGIERFASVCDCFDIDMKLNSQHMLLAIDEMSFKQMLSHLLTEFTQFQYRVPLSIETYGKGECFTFKCELGIHPMLGEFAHGFKQKLLTPPKNIEDGSLFHAYTIVKRFGGTVNFYTENNHYGLRMTFPAINMTLNNKKEPLKTILYDGTYPILKEITNMFLKKYDLDLDDYDGNKSLDDYKVVIFDESVPIGEQLLLSKKNPKTYFISFGLPEILRGANITPMQQPINMTELTKILSESFELKQVNIDYETVTDVYDILEEMDRYNIDASYSCKRNGHNAGLYFKSLKLYNLYYGSNFDKLRTLWETKQLEKLEAIVLKMQNEANVLGLTAIDDFLKSLHLNGYELLDGINGKVLYKEAFASLDNSLKVII